MSMILVKMPVRPDRQRVLVGEEGDETDMKLRQWANKKAFAEGLAGEEAAARRDELMREAVGDAGKHGLTFMDKPIPFDEEGAEPTHTMPDGTEMEGASHEEATGEAKDPMDDPRWKEYFHPAKLKSDRYGPMKPPILLLSVSLIYLR